MNKAYKYILFDLDGTLTDPFMGITRSVQYALKYYGITVDDLQQLTPFIGPPLQDSFQDFYHFSQAQANEACNKYHERFVDKGWCENVVYEGIDSFLREQKESGKQLFVATSKPEPLARKILDHFNLSQYFSFIGGDTMERTRSAKAEVIRYVLSAAGITSLQEAVMIGDRKHDIIGAKSVGMDSVGVLYGYGDKQELTEAGADYIVEDVEGLRKLLL